MDKTDRRIINHLQSGMPVSERPYAEVAARLGMEEASLIERLRNLLENGVLSRFGPMYHAERMGGGLTLCAMKVEDEDFDTVCEIVNSFREVAHNYAREHELNMWFVLATESDDQIPAVIEAIEQMVGYRIYNMPKLEEFFVGLKLCV